MDVIRLIEFLEKIENQGFLIELQKKKVLSINEIQKLTRKHQDFPIKDILSLIKIQKKNLKKNPDSLKLIYTEKGAQQSSSKLLAEYHAQKFQEYSSLADLCCGNGIDLMHLAIGKKKVYAIDLDETTLKTAKYNTKNFTNIEFIYGNAEDFEGQVEAIFVDPDRRTETGRILDVEEMSPSLSKLLRLKSITLNIAIKLSPAADYESLKLSAEHTFEFISENRVLKEILLCFGKLSTPGVTRKAILLPEGIELSTSNASIPVSGICNYLFEPDPAIIRAGLVQEIGAEIGYDLIDLHLALLSGKEVVFSKFGTTYKRVINFSYDLKKLHKYCCENQIGELIIKTRGFPIPVEKFRQKIKLKGNRKAVLFIIRLGDNHEMIIADIVS